MTQSRTRTGRKVLMTVLTAAAACFLMMSCAKPAFAKEDPGWDGQNGYVTTEETDTAGKGDPSATGDTGSAGDGSEHLQNRDLRHPVTATWGIRSRALRVRIFIRSTPRTIIPFIW